MTFFGWFGQYVIKFVILAAVAGLGIVAGKKLAARSEAKKAAEDAEKTAAADK